MSLTEQPTNYNEVMETLEKRNNEVTNIRFTLENTKKPVYVVLTPGDADALKEIDVDSVFVGDLNGINNYTLLAFEYAEQLPPLIISISGDDDTTRNYNEQLTEILRAKESLFVYQNIYKGFDTIENMLKHYGDKLPDLIRTKSDFDRLSPESFKKQYSTLSAVESLRKSLTDTNAHKHIKTGLENLDRILGHGFTDGLYIIVSTTGSGKTSLCLQIANYMADISKENTPVLYFSLEMPKDELIAKDICRHLKLNGVDITARDILNFANMKKCYRPNMENTINKMLDSYCKYVAPNLYFITEPPKEINRDNHNRLTADDIAYITRDFIRRTGQKPVVFVDYFQLLGKSKRQANMTTTDKASDDAFILKGLSRKEDSGVPVIAISSTARSNQDNDLNVTASKNSGDIEYTANAVIGIQPDGLSDINRLSKESEKKAELRKIYNSMETAKKLGHPFTLEVKLLKDRFNPNAKIKINSILKYGVFNDTYDGDDETPFEID